LAENSEFYAERSLGARSFAPKLCLALYKTAVTTWLLRQLLFQLYPEPSFITHFLLSFGTMRLLQSFSGAITCCGWALDRHESPNWLYAPGIMGLLMFLGYRFSRKTPSRLSVNGVDPPCKNLRSKLFGGT
jgi:hypothetical protein